MLLHEPSKVLPLGQEPLSQLLVLPNGCLASRGVPALTSTVKVDSCLVASMSKTWLWQQPHARSSTIANKRLSARLMQYLSSHNTTRRSFGPLSYFQQTRWVHCAARSPDAEAGAPQVRPVVEQPPPEQDAQRVKRDHALYALPTVK